MAKPVRKDTRLALVIAALILFAIFVVFQSQSSGGYSGYARRAPTIINDRTLSPAQQALEAIKAGSWHDVDLEPYNKLGNAIVEATDPDAFREGHSAQLVTERKLYVKFAQMPNVKTICEIGFNNGHSASLWLKANPTANVQMFDLWRYTGPNVAGENFLRDPEKTRPHGFTNGNERLAITKGSSLETVLEFAKANPDFKCDLLSVDGGHDYDVAFADLGNMMKLANPAFNVLVVDDTNCGQHYCVDSAVGDHLKQGTIRLVAQYAEKNYMRGVTVLQYTNTPPPPPAIDSPQGKATLKEIVSQLDESYHALQVAQKLSKMPQFETVCGFGYRFASALQTEASESLQERRRVLLFNHRKKIGFDAHGTFNTKFLDRIHVLPAAYKTNPTAVLDVVGKYPALKCDLLFLDGTMKGVNASLVLQQMHDIANPSFHVVLVQADPAAIQEVLSKGLIRQVKQFAPGPDKTKTSSTTTELLQFDGLSGEVDPASLQHVFSALPTLKDDLYFEWLKMVY